MRPTNYLKSVLFSLFLCSASHSSELPERIESFHNWSLYTQTEDDRKICFISSNPKEKYGNYKKRGTPYIWVRQISTNIDEVSITPGYRFKNDSYPKLGYYKSSLSFANAKNSIAVKAQEGRCGIQSEDLSYVFDVVDEEQAWLKDVEEDEELIKAMISGNYIVVAAQSPKNTCSFDVYSLMGFTKAYNKMKEICTEDD